MKPPYMNELMNTLVAASLVLGVQESGSEEWRCLAPPLEPCFTHHGRLSSQNGIPLKIWLINTTRMVAVERTEVPSFVEEHLEITSPKHSYVYGDFTICPLEADTPGHLRRVCVAAARRLVVQDTQFLWPAYRLLSTWRRP